MITISPIKIDTLLIANRGEISSRISRTCKKMGILSVAVYSDIDRDSPFVTDADIGVHIGGNNPADSYLDHEKIILAAKKVNADAIHPGYGFLSENYDFARKCHDAGIVFIGPHPEAIRQMGSKSEAKKIMAKHDVPTLPGYNGNDQSLQKFKLESSNIGYPILLKASAGGGGKGMRIVHQESELEKSIEAAKREAQNAFGDDTIIIEKYIQNGRHIEFQILGDKHRNIIHLNERECTIQRRYQKIIEESPSPTMTKELRSDMSAAALKAAKAIEYDNAGTVEFIYDETTDEFYFLEVNTRLQVEHPVTEEITGLDLVKMQLESAQGIPLAIKQDEVKFQGYAIEARLYAEDPENDFLPVTGLIETISYPNQLQGLRIESAIKSGTEISIFYDPMIAKLIMWDNTREGAIRKMKFALRNTICQGITTNLQFLIKLIDNDNFKKGIYNTHFLNDFDSEKINDINTVELDAAAIASTIASWQARNESRDKLKHLPSGWRNNFYTLQKDIYNYNGRELVVNYTFNHHDFIIQIDEREYQVCLLRSIGQQLQIEINKVTQTFNVSANSNILNIHNSIFGNVVLEIKSKFPDMDQASNESDYETPMPAQIVKVLVRVGQKIQIGEELVVLSSMKMENTVTSVNDGEIDEIYAVEGENVGAGFQLLKFKELD